MQQLLEQLKIKADVVNIETNGIVSRYYLKLQPGGKVKKIENCANEIALGLKSYSIPIVRLIPEKGLVSIEILTKPQGTVEFNDLKNSLLKSDDKLPVILGRTHDGEDLITDITKMPHLLIAGTTGSGKSVLLHSIICSLILQESNVRLALVDPKNVEFTHYKDTKQLMYPIINYADEAYAILSDLVDEMDDRFRIMSKKSAKDIYEYNKKRSKKLPYIVLVIDEFADLMQMSKKEFQVKLSRLAQKSRACGIHIIIATQRPSADVVTGIIKANFPARISCRVTSAINSRVVLDKNGAEKLLGKGDALISSTIYDMLRFRGAYINQVEIEKICDDNKRGLLSRIINSMRKI
jgi:S-DNA-T family DNA segregation ATPase FtsK/SpoIIIE